MKNELKIHKQVLKFTSLDKILFPDSQITKGQLLEYYLFIAPYFLKYAKNRPLTLERFPNGIDKTGFVQKHTESIPDWIEHVELPIQEGTMKYIVANKKADLAYLANLNTIVFHTAFSKTKNIEAPDLLILDLDPMDKDFAKVIWVAQKIKALGDKIGLKLLLKTTGSRGLHILAPLSLSSHITFEEIHDFAKKLGTYLAYQYPQEITIEQRKEKRGNKVLIDYSRNAYGLHAVAPYSLRAKPGAPVAAPIAWEELGTKVIQSNQFNIHNIVSRIEEKGDIWSTITYSNRTIKNIIKKFNKVIDS